MKLKVQAQHLQPGDIVGSGDSVAHIVRDSISWPNNKVQIWFQRAAPKLWGKYTLINVERAEKEQA